ncbi:MAG: hydrogenase maturation protease [Thermoleophilia bacterium]
MTETDRDAGQHAGAPAITIIGVGNTLMGDDGFGIFVVEGLDGPSLGPGVTVVAGDTAGMALLRHFLESDAVIVVDAIAAEADPGAIFRFNPDEAGVLDLRTNNIHGMGVPHLITNARLKGANPEVIVFAVQVESVTPRDRQLSDSVSVSVGRVRELIVEEVRRLLAP